MKRILSMLLLASLVIFAGCDNSSSGASAEEEAAADAVAEVVFEAAGGAVQQAIMSEFSGVSPGAERATVIEDGLSYSGTVTGTYSSFSADITVTFDNYTSDGITLDGSVTFTWNGSMDVFEGGITGDFTALYEGETYDFEYHIVLSCDGTTLTMTGYANVNGSKLTANESVAWD